VTQIERLLAFEGWANQRILAAVQALPADVSERACTVLAHVANGSLLWYQRVVGLDVTAAPWAELTLEKCALELQNAQQLWTELLRKQTDPTRLISYKNLAGKPFETPLVDILQHLSFHSHYHRGQVNAAIRAAGGTPADVDFITFQRAGN
jgi:uncharacterized damage-inducible protein DinB